MRRLVIALIAAGLAVSCGSLAVVVATVWLTPERPRPATPTAIVALPTRPAGTPRGAGPPLFTPTVAPTDTPSPPTPPPLPPTPRPAPATPSSPTEAPPTSASPAATPPVVAPTVASPPTAAPSPSRPATATPRPPSPPAAPTRPPTPTITPAPTRSPTPSPTRPPATATPTAAPTRQAPLVLTTTRLTLAPDQQASVGISYSGRGQIAWTAFSDVPWLTVTPTSGTLAGETDVLTIGARRADLAAGTHQGRVIIETGDGRVTVTVMMLVPGP